MDGLPVELKESGLAEQAGMIVLRERHKGAAWKAADAIVDPLFKLLDPEARGHIPVTKFKEYFLHRLHPELERRQHSPATSRRHGSSGVTHTRSKGTGTWDFNRVVQAARLKRQQAMHRARSSSSRSGSGGCFTSGTAVLTPTGSRVGIDQLQLGDAVMAFDSEGLLQTATVRGCMRFLSDKHLALTLSNGSVMHVTAQHPVCVAPDTFCRADALCVGHRVMVAASDCERLVGATVTRVEDVADGTVVYNLSTTPHHTFFAADVAVHNKGGGGGCFTSGTAVLTPTGSRVGIDQLQLGDAVMAFDSEGLLQTATVRGCMRFLSDKHLALTLSNGSVMHVTAQHPVCVAPDTFCRADALCVGHRVMVAASDCERLVGATVTRVEDVADGTVVYNLSTTPHHTFFAADVAVHNKGGGGGCFSGDVPVIVLSDNGGQKRVGMRMLKPGDVIQGMKLLRVSVWACD